MCVCISKTDLFIISWFLSSDIKLRLHRSYFSFLLNYLWLIPQGEMVLQNLNSSQFFFIKTITFLILHLCHGRQLASLLPLFPPSRKTLCALSCCILLGVALLGQPKARLLPAQG